MTARADGDRCHDDGDDFLDRPPYRLFRGDELSLWQRRLGRWFELGTLYTMLAGMLNVLAVYDAFAGPLGAGSTAAADAATKRR